MGTQTVLEVGAGKQFQTINAAIQAADQMGGNADIRIDAGTYTNDGGYLWDGVNNVTIEGVGGMATIIDPNYSAGGKAAIVTGGDNIVLRNLDISGVTVPDANGAGVRYDQGTLILDNVSLHGNQNGILSAADPNGSITIQNSNIYDNGVGGDGHTHNIYIGDIASFTLANSYVHDANVGHEVKSRAEVNTITNNIIADNDSDASYSIDLPNGGNATITGNTIEQGSSSQNRTINAYGEEGNLHAGIVVNFSDNVIVNDYANGAGALWSNNGGTISGSNNTLYRVTNIGNVSLTDTTTSTVRPTINTSNVGLGSSDPTGSTGGSTDTGSNPGSTDPTGSTGGSTDTGSNPGSTDPTGSTGGSTDTGSNPGSTDPTGSTGGSTDTGSNSGSTDPTGSTGGSTDTGSNPGSTDPGSTGGSTDTGSNPGSTDPTGSTGGSTDTGSNPGSTDPTGSTGGSTDTGSNPGSTDPTGSTGGSTDTGSNPGSTDPTGSTGGSTDTGSNPGSTDPGSTGGSTDTGSNPGSTDPTGSTGGSTDTGSNPGSTDPTGSTGGSTDTGSNPGSPGPTPSTPTINVNPNDPVGLTVNQWLTSTGSATIVKLSGAVITPSNGSTPVGVEIYDTTGGQTVNLGAATLTQLSQGLDMWEFATGKLSVGEHAFSVVATDDKGTTSPIVTPFAEPVNVLPINSSPTATSFIKTITGNLDGGITLAGSSDANSVVKILDVVDGRATVIGSVTSTSNGTWSIVSHDRVDTSVVNHFLMVDQNGSSTVSGQLFLTSVGADTLTSTSGVSDTFAVMSFRGEDIIRGFEPASSNASMHDYVDFSGRGITSFNQLQTMMSGTESTTIDIGHGKAIILSDVTPTALTAADFRFS